MPSTPPPFWQRPLEQLSESEWEQLCDGCGRCCLIQLEDEESGERVTTGVACRYLQRSDCSCGVYTERTTLVPECLKVSLDNVYTLDWMPASCGYRLRAEGRELATWHPLLSCDPNTIHHSGISVRYLAILESELPPDADLEEYLLYDDE